MEWIKCSERMPEKNTPYRVMAYTPGAHETLRFRLVSGDIFAQACSEASHWMYVLEPHMED
ncbi:DUF551 domain-containing protein [Cronobacter malonaticus]